MSETIEKLTTRFSALEDPTVRVGAVEDGKVYRTMIKLSDNSEWILSQEEAATLEGMVKIEASKTGLVTQRDALENFEAIIRLARDRCIEMNAVR